MWEVQIKRQLGYSFSLLHGLAYSLVALQELNLNLYYNPLYWQTACLTVNSGGLETEDDEKNKTTNYGKIATAIGNIRKKGVKIALPDINNAQFGFSPDIRNNQIIFGLKGMNGIGDDIVRSIIENRPYHSFEDFLKRLYDTKIIKNNQIIMLIKGGSFDLFGDRKEIMKRFIQHTFKPKEKLNMQNMPLLIEKDLLPKEFQLEKRFFNYKKYISNFVYKEIDKPKDKLLKLDDISQTFFEQHFSGDSVVEVSDDGHLIISEKKFKKEYNQKMKKLKEWLSKEETVQYINEMLFNELWNEYKDETLSKWEMESLSFYYHDHELINVNNDKYDIRSFTELPENPIVVKEYEYKGVPRQEFQLQRIAGTVLDKDKNKHQVTLLTTDGVVTVKFYSGSFSYYNKQISRQINKDKKEILEKSWFTRGNKLLITGFRRGNKFIPRTYKNSIYQHTVTLIKDVDQNGNLLLQTERIKVE